MVGTFYRAASPESPPFVDVGQEVNEDTVVCIIEAMKVMNEIKAEVQGVIAEVVAENGKPVQFGQALFKVRLESNLWRKLPLLASSVRLGQLGKLAPASRACSTKS